MALDDDVYRALGVTRDSDAETVKRAYRALALRNHPDRNPGDAGARARFDRVNRAYAAWCAAHAELAAQVNPEWAGKSPEEISAAIGDLFAQIFQASGAAGSQARRGADRTLELRLSPSEARTGTSRGIAVARLICCLRCRGSGADDGVTHPCAECRGTGRHPSTHGYIHVQSTCKACQGRGHWADSPCDSCDNGMSEITEAIVVVVPPEATQVRIAGKGDESPGGETGDLVLVIAVDTIGVLVRRGDDAVLETAIGAYHLMLGGPLQVAGLDGPVTVQVPRGARDGDTIVIPGGGHVRAGASTGGDPYREVARGDQLVVIRVPPSTLRAKARVIAGGLLAAVATAIGVILAI